MFLLCGCLVQLGTGTGARFELQFDSASLDSRDNRLLNAGEGMPHQRFWNVNLEPYVVDNRVGHVVEPYHCRGHGPRADQYTTTLVTALYDIGRASNGDGRTMDQYLEWLLEHTLQVRSPFVMFYSDDLVRDAVYKHIRTSPMRRHVPIILCQAPIESMPYHYLEPQVQSIQQSARYREKFQSLDVSEAKLPLYVPLQFSKFQWLAQVAKSNPFASEYVFWVDAGAGRWTTGVEGHEWPRPQKLADLQSGMSSEHIVVAQMYPGYDQLQRAWGRDLEAFLWSNTHYIAGTTFGGSKNTTFWLANEMHDILVEEFIQLYQLVNTEQHALFVLWLRHSSKFALVPGICPEDVGCRGFYNDFLTIYDILS